MSLRILWQSNSPWCNTGYGMQTHQATQRIFRELGHHVDIFPFYGHSGHIIEWEGMNLLPCEPGQDWGQTRGKMYYDEYKSDVLITLQDVWPLQGLSTEVRWVPWTPIDHDPAPPAVLEMLHHVSVVKPIAMTKWGQAKLKEKDIPSYYIPHGVHTQCFAPRDDWREEWRKKMGWEDTFVVGTVGTNTVERKNWNASIHGFAKFAKGKSDVVYYMHTALVSLTGIDIDMLRHHLGIEDITCFPSPQSMMIGVSPESMAKRYNAMDVFLLPTKGEGFGIPIVEAQACGTPVIVTNCTSHPELVGGGWFLEDLRPEWTLQNSYQFNCTSDEVAEKLELAYADWKNGNTAEKAQKARDKALEYDWDVLIKDYWKPVLEDIEERVKTPNNCEGIQEWRQIFLPQTCTPRKVLDLGSGVTRPYKKLLRTMGDYVAVDIRGGEGVIQADAHNLPFEDGEFGYVFCSEMLEHVEDPARVVEEAKRVGKHGVFIFSTPVNPYFRLDPEHKAVNIPHNVLASGDGVILW